MRFVYIVRESGNMIDSNREEFEKLPEIRKIMNENGIYFMNHSGWYEARYFKDFEYEQYINGAWYAYQEQQKKLDCCREENKALLERLAVYDKHVKAIKHIHETQFDENTDTSFILGNLDGFIEYLESDLKGNKDEN